MSLSFSEQVRLGYLDREPELPNWFCKGAACTEQALDTPLDPIPTDEDAPTYAHPTWRCPVCGYDNTTDDIQP